MDEKKTCYDTMVESNKKNWSRMEEEVLREISIMLDQDIMVTVADLVKRTGRSRAYFYNNPTIKAKIDEARRLQKGKVLTHPQKTILDKAIERQNAKYEKEVAKLRQQIEELKAEKEKAERSLNRKTTSFLKNL